ncbi:hypothetical protein PsorP6_002746 [Peronosclerospora sorghi]|uniref:Uncharacterized protein n=1 Tax=Peronosclerospora sorghi TaxID=230839 RepID=A0ACC0WV57_9STRA|nr:hypothetical protein PsorP6_002746 [Peronosclerospora sorghi]
MSTETPRNGEGVAPPREAGPSVYFGQTLLIIRLPSMRNTSLARIVKRLMESTGSRSAKTHLVQYKPFKLYLETLDEQPASVANHTNKKKQKDKKNAAVRSFFKNYDNWEQFKDAVNEHKILHGYATKTQAKRESSAQIKCKADGCSFDITASRKKASLQQIRDRRFKQLFMCPGQIVNAFPHLLPIVAIDGTFIKNTQCKGTLLLATSLDGNNNTVQMAYALVSVEFGSTWDWFLRQLVIPIPQFKSSEITLLSDRETGLLNSVDEILPDNQHVYCLRHICEN